MKKGITFIVPVFNTSKTIAKCIRSLVRFRDTYVVAVDDGSTDDSREVLDKLATKYDNLRVVHSKKDGVSSARNIGLSYVETELVGFCDSDDYYQQFNPLDFTDGTADLRVFSFEYKGDKRYPDGSLYSENKIMSSKEYLEEMGNNFYTMFFGAVWNKIYKTEIIKNNNIKFESDVRVGEDVMFNARYVRHIENVAITVNKICNYFLYKYEGDEDYDGVIQYYHDTVTRLKVFRKICKEKNVDVDEKYYNYMSMEMIEPIKVILHKYKKKEAIEKFKDLFDNDDVIESLQHYTGNCRRVKILANNIPAKKWNKSYYISKMILIAKGD